MINNVEDVKKAISACFYPPSGSRGMGLYRAQGYGDKDKKEEDRLYEIFNDLNELINHWNPNVAAVEKFFFYRSSTTISVVQARGVIMMVLASKQIHVSEYSPAQIKLTIAGSGKASKKEVLEAVMYSLELKKPPKPDDSADALAIALTKLNEDGFN